MAEHLPSTQQANFGVLVEVVEIIAHWLVGSSELILEFRADQLFDIVMNDTLFAFLNLVANWDFEFAVLDDIYVFRLVALAVDNLFPFYLDYCKRIH